ncbi:Acetyltransferase (GNAT) family protein [Albimonas donghaensis]|uniref:Acetyltransferase (GNAT) family protein n=1 Tax=Albimonas donghaensis TaxID=356660 RepID=A0A1H2SZG3_9RHOB|nr:GNAT family N-acetyltransferase [Albimonas donghaensis]SDW36429.1 Acetyltransferase (GNAT) family protein [Albimonas donghaensis]
MTRAPLSDPGAGSAAEPRPTGRVEIAEATSPEDLAAIRALCRAFRTWLMVRYVDHPDIIEAYYAEDRWEALLDDLPRLHAAPEGAILLARLDGRPAGCAMFAPLPEPDACEMKRMYVDGFARGTGVAAGLVEALCALAKARGRTVMRLDTGRIQVEAQALYARRGFVVRGPYYEAPPSLADFLVFMERPL